MSGAGFDSSRGKAVEMEWTCDDCGAAADSEERLVRVRRSFSLRTRKFCPRCVTALRQKRDRVAAWFNLGWGTFAVVAIVSLVSVGDGGLSWDAVKAGWQVGSVLAGAVVGGAVGLWLHEAAHALVAWALGMKVWRFSIGAGRRLVVRDRGDFRLEVRTWWAFGCVVAEPKETLRPTLAWALMVVAGPLMNLLLALVAGVWWWKGETGTLADFVRFFALANGLVFVLSAWPHEVAVAGGLPSDGLQILSLLRDRGARYRDKYLRDGAAAASMELLVRGRVDESLAQIDRALDVGLDDAVKRQLRVDRGVALIRAGRFKDAAGWGETLLAEPDWEPPERALLLNNRVWAELLAGRRDSAAEWETQLRESMKTLPGVHALGSTAAACRIATGDAEAGGELMERAKAEDEAGDFHGVQLAWLAVASAQKGDLARASDFLIEARQVQPDSVEIDAVVRHYLPAGHIPDAV